jgi:hypothetical protein
MGCLLGICVVSRNASGARTCAPSEVLENRLCASFPCAKSWAAFGHAGGSKGEGGCTVDVGYGAYLGERGWLEEYKPVFSEASLGRPLTQRALRNFPLGT